ncbi:MAG: hypothetical protein R3Y23_01005 [Bacillota bacterium]
MEVIYMSCNIRTCSPPEKICVQLERVFDSSINKFTDESREIALTFSSGTPVDYVSAESTGTVDITSQTITSIDNSRCSRVQYTVEIPLTVTATDSSGSTITGTSTVTYTQDILLRVPREALVPYSLNVIASVNSAIGTISSDGTTATITCCVTLIAQIIADVMVVLQTCGYANISPAEEYGEDVCTEVFSLPVYPR